MKNFLIKLLKNKWTYIVIFAIIVFILIFFLQETIKNFFIAMFGLIFAGAFASEINKYKNEIDKKTQGKKKTDEKINNSDYSNYNDNGTLRKRK
jgi:hypothetical protein